ncbi:MAG: FAD-binding protein [Promethearchaeota archaeon]
MAFEIEGMHVRAGIFNKSAVIIGSGAAALNCALHLVEFGLKSDDVMIVTDSWGGGTSFNAGSDKQTYYKLSISGDGADSPILMANDLFRGGSMHGDIALAEAAGSIEEFFHLVRLGVQFPRDEYGVYPGYQTDNDVKQRATSVGPYTSREMVEVLARRVVELGIPVLNHHVALKILSEGGGNKARARGIIALDCQKVDPELTRLKENREIDLECILAPAVIYATGGPANIYKNSVYPVNHFCGHGLGIDCGAKLQNLSFMQYGIASVKFRWNLSGSYQQVIPSYYILDRDTGEPVEILSEYFPSMADLSLNVFLKGYQWPFNPDRCDVSERSHSSLVDLIVYRESIENGNRVFMDFQVNPWDLAGDEFSLKDLPSAAYTYLKERGALQETPIERLAALNPFAIEVYENHAIDLSREPIEIQVAVQHCNGGFAANVNWESVNVSGLFPVGEVNGSHGQHRPGGAALNSGQVGGLQAARYLAQTHRGRGETSSAFNLRSILKPSLAGIINRVANSLFDSNIGRLNGLSEHWSAIKSRMASCASIIRGRASLEAAAGEAWQTVIELKNGVELKTRADLISYFRCMDAALTHFTILGAMLEQIKIQPDLHPCYFQAPNPSRCIDDVLLGNYRFSRIQHERGGILGIRYDGSHLQHELVEVREIPDYKIWFEKLLKKSRA